jgi:ribosomal protein L15E
VNRRETLGQDFTVGTVRAEDVIVRIEQIGLPDRRRLLTDREMRRTAVVVRNVLKVPLLLDRVEHLLERADDHHVALNPQQVRLGEIACGQLIRQAAIVLVERNRLEVQHAPRPHLDRINL